MKAVVMREHGGPEVLKVEDVPKPVPGPNDILVEVHASSVNPFDCRMKSGEGLKLPAILGYDASGVVESVGAGVSDFKAGDEVFYTAEVNSNGTYAEYHVVDSSIVQMKPTNLDHPLAAAVPLAGCTAWQALMSRGDLRIGQVVLIHGGAGGVGSLAIQIAKAGGAYVFTTCGGYDTELVCSLGADRPIDYRKEDFVKVIREETREGVDLILNTVSAIGLGKNFEAVRPNGKVVTIVNQEEGSDVVFRKNLTLHFLYMERRRATLSRLKDLLERKNIKPVIDSFMPLEEAAQAHRTLEKGGIKGKIVLKVK